MHFIAATSEKCVNIRTKQMTIAAGDIHIHVRLGIQPVHQPLETFYFLNLIKHQIIVTILLDALVQISFESIDLKQVITHIFVILIERQRNNMIFRHTLLQQVIAIYV